jgi:hypothetical protein
MALLVNYTMYIVSNDRIVSYEVATMWKETDRGLIYWGIILAFEAGLRKRAKDINQDTERREITFRVSNKSNFASDPQIQLD